MFESYKKQLHFHVGLQTNITNNNYLRHTIISFPFCTLNSMNWCTLFSPEVGEFLTRHVKLKIVYRILRPAFSSESSKAPLPSLRGKKNLLNQKIKFPLLHEGKTPSSGRVKTPSLM